MKSKSHNLIIKAAKVLAALLLIWLIAAIGFNYWLWRSLHIDYSTKPPREVFQLVLHQDIPGGVSNLKVAGKIQTVWMRFSATDAAITKLLGNKNLSLNGPDDSLNWVTKEQIMDNKDALAIGWDKVLHLKHFQSYKYAFIPGGTGWAGEIVIDREHHVVYTNSGAM